MANCTVLVSTVIIFFLLLEPKDNGFNCNDTSIRQPFIKLQVSMAQLLSISVGLPIIAIVVIEKFISKISKTNNKLIIYHNIIAFIFGLFFNFLLVMIMKNLFGRLRPHTIRFCNADHYCPEGFIDKHIETFECRNDDYPMRYKRNVRHSFYSGHASIGLYAGAFLILYLRSKLRPKHNLWKYILKSLYLIIAITSTYPGYTQWKNYWHFSSDVLTGYAIGIVSAISIYKLFLSNTISDHQLIDKNNANNYIPLNKLLTTTISFNR
ncbi:putative phosphatidate phosphatase [Oppia nitens]|uniref:putative phosphatidate phosphatase n=1 Tax=Oppia nitens TaxID=1686743 RepID=UPI0023DC868A|nr:putative phosphatidate phosphatase [Oppia nitens]